MAFGRLGAWVASARADVHILGVMSMVRWIALAITLLCFASCSFLSQNVFRGMIAPVAVLVGSIVTVFLFVKARVDLGSRPESLVVLDPKTQAALKQKAAERKVEELKAKLAQQTVNKPADSKEAG